MGGGRQQHWLNFDVLFSSNLQQHSQCQTLLPIATCVSMNSHYRDSVSRSDGIISFWPSTGQITALTTPRYTATNKKYHGLLLARASMRNASSVSCTCTFSIYVIRKKLNYELGLPRQEIIPLGLHYMSVWVWDVLCAPHCKSSLCSEINKLLFVVASGQTCWRKLEMTILTHKTLQWHEGF